MSVETDIQRLDIGDVPELFEVDCTAIFGQILRFTISPLIVDANNPVSRPVTWRGDVYEPRACQASGFVWDGKGPLPQPKMTIGNTDLAISALCIGYSDLQGAKVTRHRVPINYLDGMPDADPDVEFDPDIFVIDQKTSQNKVAVEFALGSAIDVEGRFLPGRQVTQNYCPWRYRRWDGAQFIYNQGSAACPYTGDPMFDERGNPTSDPAKDKCSKRVNSGCKVRYPNVDMPFGGFPGVAKYRG